MPAVQNERHGRKRRRAAATGRKNRREIPRSARNDERRWAIGLAGVGEGEGGGVTGAGGHEALDLLDGVDGTAGANGGAIQCGGSAGKIELLLQGPALQQRVDETGVEKVARAGGVHRLDLKSR